MHRRQELLDPFVLRFSLERHKCRPTPLSSLTPPTRDFHHAVRLVGNPFNVKARLVQVQLVCTRRAKHKEADRTASRKLGVRHETGKHNGVSEQAPTANAENAPPFPESAEAVRKMVNRVVAKYEVERPVRERQRAV